MGLAKEAQACAVPPYFPAACRVRRRIPRAHPGGMPAISRGLRRFAPIPPDCRRNQFDPGRGRRPCVRPRDPHGSLRVVCGCWRKCVARLPALAPHPGCDWFLPDSRGYCFAQPPANGWKPSGFPWSLAIFGGVRTEIVDAAAVVVVGGGLGCPAARSRAEPIAARTVPPHLKSERRRSWDRRLGRTVGSRNQALPSSSLARSAMAALRLRRTRPFSSTPMHLTQMTSPILTTSSVALTRKSASSLM